MFKKLFFSVAFFLCIGLLTAQSSVDIDQTYVSKSDSILKAPANWFNLDLQADMVRGVSTEKAYSELLPNKKSKTVIVAIIDSGIDIEHEDLKDKIWTNPGEIAGNGIDDDKNGYVDDVHGWDFIGNAKGEFVSHDNLELTRLYVKYKKTYDGKLVTDFKGRQRDEFNFYQELKSEYENKLQPVKQNFAIYKNFMVAYTASDEAVKKFLNKDNYTNDEVQAIQSDDADIKKAKQIFGIISTNNIKIDDIKEWVNYLENQINYDLNLDFDPRNIVGDDYSNTREKFYGNNKVKGPDALHGTHVAGIIGANRTNDIGIKGIASDIKIMVIRAVPDGDERDKDVANAVYYAANNGAQIINMSFGKPYSPNKDVVDAAFKYAEKKGILIIHAAGNDNQNIDVKKQFPCATYLKSKKAYKSWIEVGASSWENSAEFVAGFSNYGSKSVDVFAPGVDIYSTVPDNKYKKEDGTSMAAPVVTGIAALVLSYYPELKANQLKEIILKSVTNNGSEMVTLPGTQGDKIQFSKLCSTGGIVNAYNALKLAETYKK
jgi:subtilisin family serine protease